MATHKLLDTQVAHTLAGEIIDHGIVVEVALDGYATLLCADGAIRYASPCNLRPIQ